jgi:hypothetical protein
MGLLALVMVVAAGLCGLALAFFGIDAKERSKWWVRWCIGVAGAVTIAGAIIGYVANERSNSALLGAVTGGDSFAYIEPQDHAGETLGFVAFNHGDNPLADVRVAMWSRTFGPEKLGLEPPVIVGGIAGGDHRPVDWRLAPDLGTDGAASYTFDVSAQNGTVQERVLIRRGHDGRAWGTRIEVTRRCADKDPSAYKPCPLIPLTPWSDEPPPTSPTT